MYYMQIQTLISDWPTSLRGNSFNSCAKCREYHKIYWKYIHEVRLNHGKAHFKLSVGSII